MRSRASVVYIAYGIEAIDTSWIPDDASVVVLHNDNLLPPENVDHPGAEHVFPPGNLGFGAAVNLAVEHIRTERVIMCNPDTVLSAAHWQALSSGAPNEVRTVPLVDSRGRLTSVINRYPTPLYLLLGAYKTGRLLHRGSRARSLLAPLLGAPGRDHIRLTTAAGGQWPLSDYWPSAAVLSLDAKRFREVGGFDASYFLYVEDLDLAVRLRQRFADMVVVLAETQPGIHTVGRSTSGELVKRHLHELSSMRVYAKRQNGAGWRLAELAMRPLSAWLAWRRRTVP